MISHVVLFSPRTDVSDVTRRDLLHSLAAAADAIPAVKRFLVGRRVLHGLAGYEQMMGEDFAFAVIVEVENLDGLKAYLAHPAHAAVGRHFTASASRSLAYDYDMVEAREAVTLLP